MAVPEDYQTVGHLYRGIEAGLRDLTDRMGERGLFVGSPRAQATPELLRWPQLLAVTGLDSGQTVVTAGSQTLRPGQRVEIATERKP